MIAGGVVALVAFAQFAFAPLIALFVPRGSILGARGIYGFFPAEVLNLTNALMLIDFGRGSGDWAISATPALLGLVPLLG